MDNWLALVVEELKKNGIKFEYMRLNKSNPEFEFYTEETSLECVKSILLTHAPAVVGVRVIVK